MSLEIISGLIGGFFGITIANFLGKFRLWKVFVASMIFIYAALFLLGLVMVGFQATISKFGEFFSPLAIKIFVGLSALVTFIAAVGRTVKGNAEPKKSEDDKS